MVLRAFPPSHISLVVDESASSIICKLETCKNLTMQYNVKHSYKLPTNLGNFDIFMSVINSYYNICIYTISYQSSLRFICYDFEF